MAVIVHVCSHAPVGDLSPLSATTTQLTCNHYEVRLREGPTANYVAQALRIELWRGDEVARAKMESRAEGAEKNTLTAEQLKGLFTPEQVEQSRQLELRVRLGNRLGTHTQTHAHMISLLACGDPCPFPSPPSVANGRTKTCGREGTSRFAAFPSQHVVQHDLPCLLRRKPDGRGGE